MDKTWGGDTADTSIQLTLTINLEIHLKFVRRMTIIEQLDISSDALRLQGNGI